MKLGDNPPAEAVTWAFLPLALTVIGLAVGAYGLWIIYSNHKNQASPKMGIIVTIAGFGLALLIFLVQKIIFVGF